MGRIVDIEIARESVYTLQAQKSNMKFFAIAHEHASECDRVFNPGASLHAPVVASEVVIPDVELLEIGHMKYSLIAIEDFVHNKFPFCLPALQEI